MVLYEIKYWNYPPMLQREVMMLVTQKILVNAFPMYKPSLNERRVQTCNVNVLLGFRFIADFA